MPGGGSIGDAGGADRVDCCSDSFKSTVGFNSIIEMSTKSPQSPRTQPEWMAAVRGSESSVYISVPHTARRRQTCSRSSFER